MIHPHTELRFASPEKGFGVFARQPIPQGTITWVLDSLDHLLTAAAAARLPVGLMAAFDHDYYRNWDGLYVLTHDHARFMNHSCRPNCAHAFSDVEIAIRDIAAGEELSNDYASLGLDEREQFQCFCGESECRRWVRHDDPPSKRRYWDPLLTEALRRSQTVAQPLRFLFGQSSLERIDDRPAQQPVGLDTQPRIKSDRLLAAGPASRQRR